MWFVDNTAGEQFQKWEVWEVGKKGAFNTSRRKLRKLLVTVVSLKGFRHWWILFLWNKIQGNLKPSINPKFCYQLATVYPDFFMYAILVFNLTSSLFRSNDYSWQSLLSSCTIIKRVPLIRMSPCLQKVVMRVRRSTTLYISGTRSEGTMAAGNYVDMMQRAVQVPRGQVVKPFFLLRQRVTVSGNQPTVLLTTVVWCGNWIGVIDKKCLSGTLRFSNNN